MRIFEEHHFTALKYHVEIGDRRSTKLTAIGRWHRTHHLEMASSIARFEEICTDAVQIESASRSAAGKISQVFGRNLRADHMSDIFGSWLSPVRLPVQPPAPRPLQSLGEQSPCCSKSWASMIAA